MSELPKELEWKKHDCEKLVSDGSIWLVALEILNRPTNKKFWHVDKVRVSCDGDEDGGFFDLTYADSDEPYDYWDWTDFEFSIKLAD